MKLVMIGTPTCASCKREKPRVSEKCESLGLEFEYYHLNQMPEGISTDLMSSSVKSAPAFLLYDGDTFSVHTKNDIHDVLNSLHL